MITIGIRAEPLAINFVIYDSEQRSIINSEKIKIPKALSLPDSLKYVRVNILDVLREYEVESAGIRITESSSQTVKIQRIQNEAVIIEAFSSSPLKKYFCGQVATITKLLNIERADFKRYVDGISAFTEVDNWEEFKKLEREACLAALGAVNA